MIDKNRTEGAAKKMGGDVKKGIGKLTGDEKLKREGQADKVEGKAQNAIGSAKDKLRKKL